MKEIWKDIYFIDKGITYDYRGLYQVSNIGRVKSVERKVKSKNGYRIVKERILKSKINRYGYYEVGLSKNSKIKTIRVNRIVASMFIPNPNNYPVVNHISGAKIDNNSKNLEWCSQSENLKHAFRIGLMKRSTPMKGRTGEKHPKSKKVNQYDLQGNFIKTWDCIRSVERKLNINSQNISACCRGTRNRTGGYRWGYANKG